jgi:hypothetical protein
METVIRDVTLETVSQAIANRTGIKPGESFSVVVVDSAPCPPPRLADVVKGYRTPAPTAAAVHLGAGVR